MSVVDLKVQDDLTVTDDVSIGGILGVTGVLTTTAATVFNGGFVANDGSTITTADNTTQLTLASTDTDANVGPVLDLFRNVTGATNDEIGRIQFTGKNDAGTDHTYANISSNIVDATSSGNTEDGSLVFQTIVAGSVRDRLNILSDQIVINQEGRDLDFRVESDGNANMLFVNGENNAVIIGHNDATNGTFASSQRLQMVGTDFLSSSFGLSRFSADGSGPSISLSKSRASGIGTDTVVQDNDELGSLIFTGADGTDLATQGAIITAEVDGTPGGNDMPTRLTFATTGDGNSSPTERVRIDSSGNVGIGTTAINAGIDIAAKGTFTGGNQHTYPTGNAYIKVQGTVNEHNWIGIEGGYNGSSGSANLFLQGCVRNVNEQAGNYIASEVQAAADCDITFGKLVAGANTSTRAAKSEHMRIDSSGDVLIGTTVAPQSGKFAVNSGISTSSALVIEMQQATDSANKAAAAFGLSIGNGGQNTNASDLTFLTASGGSLGERMRITSAGKLLVGTTASNSTGLIQGRHNTGASNAVITTWNEAGSGTRIHMQFLDSSSGADRGSITTNGSATAYNTSSDYRLKENVVTDWDATSRLKQLKPSRFNFKTDADTTVDGFLAHEVSSIVPEAVTGTKDEEDADGNPKYQGIDQSKLVPLLVKTIQELEARITALEG